MLGITQIGISQTKDTVAVDSVKYFQYRISFDNIKTLSVAESISPQLRDMFQSKPSFSEIMGEYIFVSTKDITMVDIKKPFENGEFKVIYFRKDLINRNWLLTKNPDK